MLEYKRIVQSSKVNTNWKFDRLQEATLKKESPEKNQRCNRNCQRSSLTPFLPFTSKYLALVIATRYCKTYLHILRYNTGIY